MSFSNKLNNVDDGETLLIVGSFRSWHVAKHEAIDKEDGSLRELHELHLIGRKCGKSSSLVNSSGRPHGRKACSAADRVGHKIEVR